MVRLWSHRRGQALRGSDGPGDHSQHVLSDEEAANIALAVTHEVREEMGRGLDSGERLSAPSPEEVRKRREERHRWEERRMREDEGYY